MEVLINENSIKRYIVSYLSSGKREGKYKVSKSKIIAAILYKLKAGCQWRQLPTKALFADYPLSWQGVYYHFRKWAQDGSFRKVWVELLREHRKLLDLPECAGRRQPNYLQLTHSLRNLSPTLACLPLLSFYRPIYS